MICLIIAYTLSISLRASTTYEFITSVILFSLSPFIIAILFSLLNYKSPHTNALDSIASFRVLPLHLAFKYACILFVCSVLGFVLVFMWHTYIRGGGDLYLGLKEIYEHDFLRRMVGGKAENFNPVYANSLNASALKVIKMYITGDTFKIALSICIFICIIEQNKAMRNYYIALLVGFSLPALSWFILGKAHSYIHTHFCYVLWYLGFMASLAYIICSYIYRRNRG